MSKKRRTSGGTSDSTSEAAADGGRQHLYQRIKTDLLQRIRSGQWRPGDAVPGDADLAREYGCARMTAHRALRDLADAGLIERRRRRGSRVALRHGRTALLDIPRVDHEIEASGASYGYRLLERAVRAPPPATRERLRIPARTKALWVLCLHFADDDPFQLEQRWIDVRTAPGSVHEPFDVAGPNRWLLEHVPWSNAEHTISALSAERAVADHLQVEVGSPLLALERRTFLDERVVTAVRLLHPGERYRMQTRISPPGKPDTAASEA